MEKVATFEELSKVYDFLEVLDAHEALDLRLQAEQLAHEMAAKAQKGRPR